MTRFRRLTPMLAALLVLAGCVSNNRPWMKDDTPRSEADQALADCKYQAEQATIGIGAGRHYRSYEDAIGAGIADGIEQGMDERKLVKDCMTAKGFTQ